MTPMPCLEVMKVIPRHLHPAKLAWAGMAKSTESLCFTLCFIVDDHALALHRLHPASDRDVVEPSLKREGSIFSRLFLSFLANGFPASDACEEEILSFMNPAAILSGDIQSDRM